LYTVVYLIPQNQRTDSHFSSWDTADTHYTGVLVYLPVGLLEDVATMYENCIVGDTSRFDQWCQQISISNQTTFSMKLSKRYIHLLFKHNDCDIIWPRLAVSMQR